MCISYKADDFIRTAKRENNAKRSFLYVNPLQGKHVPASPSEVMRVFAGLSDKIAEAYSGERLLVIGFAETATAIGGAAAYLNPDVCAFLTTTREDADGAEYLFFTESHSHAAEQRLAVNGLDVLLDGIDRIVFAEDEVTTGNTIRKLMSAMQAHFPEKKLHFGIASVLNSMSDGHLDAFRKNGVECLCLAKIPYGFRTDEVDKYVYKPLNKDLAAPVSLRIKEAEVKLSWNPRIAAGSDCLRSACAGFLRFAEKECPASDRPQDILVLGTEEFMLPGLLFAQNLEKNGHKVKFHATTRSPIEVSDHKDYPLHERFPLASLYDGGRPTYVYNLRRYDKVVITTDSSCADRRGIESLLGALEKCGNDDVTLLKWSRR